MNPAALFISRFALCLALCLAAAAFAADPEFRGEKLSPAERMKREHLRRAHDDAKRFQSARKTPEAVPGLHDFKGILHAHAEDSAHTGGTRPEMLADAKKAGVKLSC